MRILIFFLVLLSCKPHEELMGKIELEGISVGTFGLSLVNSSINVAVPIDKPITIRFKKPLLASSINAISISSDAILPINLSLSADLKSVIVAPTVNLATNTQYIITISSALKGKAGEEFSERTVSFITRQADLKILSFKIGSVIVNESSQPVDIALDATVEIDFSEPLKPATLTAENIRLTGDQPLVLNLSLVNSNKTLIIAAESNLRGLQRHQLSISSSLKAVNDQNFTGLNFTFYTVIDPAPKFPLLSDDELLTLVQQQTFKYFWDFAHPASGMARERNTSGDLVTSGGSGFGLMAIIVGIERGFITREEGVQRLDKILTFLEKADRFHGVWSHWINGNTGAVIPFSTKDNGGDLVETSFLVQGLITFRQYLDAANPTESDLINRINILWEGVEWDWYRKNNENVLYWHWSPNYNWDMNFAMYGYFEQQITYFLAAASPTHSIPKSVYVNGFARNGNIVQNNTYYGINLKLGGLFPLFWVHYSYLGLDPHFTDDYADYWIQNVNASRINQAYCITNPKKYVAYSEACWGLTSSDNQSGYNSHSPSNDLGVITPTAALSSFPYTPDESMKALKFFYYNLGDKLWGPYGFYDSFNITQGWYANSYLAIDQGPIIIMIENHRTGLLWELFMSAPEVQNAATKLNFTF